MKTLALIILALPLAASAATLTVNTTADNLTAGDGKCTLREAIANVNTAADATGGDCTAGTGNGDTITFVLVLPATIQLDPMLGELTIHANLTLTGPVTGSLRIDGGGKTRVFKIAAGTTNLSDLTIMHGNSPDQGGGILISYGAVAALINCTLSGNSAAGRGDFSSSGGGGAIYNSGTATLSNCALTRNRARGGRSAGYGYGGGFYNDGGTATLTNCTLSGNRAGGLWYFGGGGGFYNGGGNVTLTNCTLRGNRAPAGGGLENGYGRVTLKNCTLTRNGGGGLRGSGGGLMNDGGISTLTDCTLSQNSAMNGGGIANFGTIILTNCTLSRNRGANGGGIVNAGGAILALTNCTLSSNRGHSGTAIQNDGGTVTLTSCTLSGNRSYRGNGILCSNRDGAFVNLTNTIIAGGGPRGNCRTDDCPITSGGHNLSSDSTCFASGGTDMLSTQPLLARLGSYGGPTQTLALCTGPGVPAASCTAASPAIDTGDDSVTGPPDNLTTDQRGLPRLSGAHVDIGAYEVQ